METIISRYGKMKGKWKMKSGYCGCDRYILGIGVKCPHCKRRMPGAKVKAKNEVRKLLNELSII